MLSVSLFVVAGLCACSCFTVVHGSLWFLMAVVFMLDSCSLSVGRSSDCNHDQRDNPKQYETILILCTYDLDLDLDFRPLV